MQPLPSSVAMTTYRPSQTLHPLSLLAQVSSRQMTGCLKVMTAETTWYIYLDRGRLIFATNLDQAFDRLDLHLRRLNRQVLTLVSAVRVQVRLLFEKVDDSLPEGISDYQAIAWLVEQNHLQIDQAEMLIETISKEVIEGFLQIKEGSYELLETDPLMGLPKFAHFSLRPLVEECYGRVKQRQANGQAPTQTAPAAASSSGNATPVLGRKPPLTAPIHSNGHAVSTPGGRGGQTLTKTHYTIACIDDSPTVLRAINDFLDDKMFSVLMIDNPVKALMQVVRNKPDLILLDVTMPNLDGYELCSLLRRHPDFKNTPIIMVTSNTGFIDRAKAKLVRASGYLTKPFDQSDLLKMVFKHLT